jgi:hypothetical protein
LGQDAAHGTEYDFASAAESTSSLITEVWPDSRNEIIAVVKIMMIGAIR